MQGDEQHLGSATLTVLNDEDVAISTLAKAMETKPLLMLSKLLRIDNRKPDSELLSYLRDSKEVLLQLLRLGDPEGICAVPEPFRMFFIDLRKYTCTSLMELFAHCRCHITLVHVCLEAVFTSVYEISGNF